MTKAQLQAVERHGRKLLAIFPHAREQNPVKLCKKLRALEQKAHRLAERRCNEDVGLAGEIAVEDILTRTNALLGNEFPAIGVFFNCDPRGYALKINSEDAKSLDIPKDWGGYGILAPEINSEGL